MTEARTARAQNELNQTFIEKVRSSGAALPDGSLLLLTTIGARTGRPRTVPLRYTRDGAAYVVVASYLGSPTHPDWYHNLLARPVATVELPGERFEVRCSVAEGELRDRLFAMQAAHMPVFAEYQHKTSRQIPVVLLRGIRCPNGQRHEPRSP